VHSWHESIESQRPPAQKVQASGPSKINYTLAGGSRCQRHCQKQCRSKRKTRGKNGLVNRDAVMTAMLHSRCSWDWSGLISASFAHGTRVPGSIVHTPGQCIHSHGNPCCTAPRLCRVQSFWGLCCVRSSLVAKDSFASTIRRPYFTLCRILNLAAIYYYYITNPRPIHLVPCLVKGEGWRNTLFAFLCIIGPHGY
jgi:hypothetical protein